MSLPTAEGRLGTGSAPVPPDSRPKGLVMPFTFTLKRAHSLATLLIAAALPALGCSSKNGNSDYATKASGGNVDTTALQTSAFVPAYGPGVHVTRTDTKSVEKST